MEKSGWPSGKRWVAQWKTLGGPRVEIAQVRLFATKQAKKAGTPSKGYQMVNKNAASARNFFAAAHPHAAGRSCVAPSGDPQKIRHALTPGLLRRLSTETAEYVQN